MADLRDRADGDLEQAGGVVLATTCDARRRCQLVRQADVVDVRRRAARYTSFRKALRQLDAIHHQLKAILRGLMKGRNLPFE